MPSRGASSGRSRSAPTSPPGRHLQYRVDFAADSTAALQYVKVFRLNRNRPPQITISAPTGGTTWSGSKQVRWKAKDPDDDTLTFEVFVSADQGETWKKVERKAAREEEEEEKTPGSEQGPDDQHEGSEPDAEEMSL